MNRWFNKLNKEINLYRIVQTKLYRGSILSDREHPWPHVKYGLHRVTFFQRIWSGKGRKKGNHPLDQRPMSTVIKHSEHIHLSSDVMKKHNNTKQNKIQSFASVIFTIYSQSTYIEKCWTWKCRKKSPCRIILNKRKYPFIKMEDGKVK